MKVVSLILFLFFALTSCSKKIVVHSLNPPNYPQVLKYRKIAVLPFHGYGGREFAIELESYLANVYVNGKPYFKLVDRNTIEKVLAEQKFSHSGLVNEKDAVKIGRILGVQGILTGAVLNADVTRKFYYEDRVACLDSKCKKLTTYKVRCTRYDAVFSFVPRLIDVETAEVVFSKKYLGTSSSKSCIDESVYINRDELLEIAKKNAISQFLKDVAPYTTTQTIPILDDDSEIKFSKDKDSFEKSLDFADKGMLDKACGIWENLVKKYPKSVVLNYDLGVCYEAKGELEKAYMFYKRAYNLMNEPIEEVQEALNRITAKLRKYKFLKKSLIKF